MFQHRRRNRGLRAAALGLLVLSACESPTGSGISGPGGSTLATLQIGVNDDGAGIYSAGIRFEGVEVRVGDRKHRLSPSGRVSVAVEAGQYTITLIGLPSGCAMEGEDPFVVSVPAGRTVSVMLSVTCLNPT